MAVLDQRSRIDGLSVAMLVAGGIVLNAGLKNATIADTLRAAIKGKSPVSGPSGIDLGLAAVGAAQAGAVAVGGTAMGAQVAAKALTYVGVPYKWAKATPDGWDCSGFVTWVLHHDFGIELPSNTHTVSGVFLVMPQAVSILRSRCAAGDLVCYPSHIGIAISGEEMVNAPRPGTSTRVDKIWSVPTPVIRRPRAYGA